MHTHKGLSEKEQEIKKALNEEIRSKSQSLTQEKSENSKLEERLLISKDSKEFLEKVFPNSWKEKKAKARSTAVEEAYLNWKRRGMYDIEEEQEGEADESLRNSTGQMTEEKLREQFERKLSQHEIEEVEVFEDKYPMKFEKSSELMSIFRELEKKSLFLVQTTQIKEQSLQNMKDELEFLRKNKEKTLEAQSKVKENLNKEVEQLNKKIKALEEKKKLKVDNSKQTVFNNLKRLITDIMTTFGNDFENNSFSSFFSNSKG